jgi:hypothetical protein
MTLLFFLNTISVLLELLDKHWNKEMSCYCSSLPSNKRNMSMISGNNFFCGESNSTVVGYYIIS